MSNDERSYREAYIPAPKRLGSRKAFRGKCDVRLTAEEDLMLTRLAEKNEVTRSDIMRRALRDFVKFNSE